MVALYLNPVFDFPQRVSTIARKPGFNQTMRVYMDLTPGDIIEVDDATASDLLSRVVDVKNDEEARRTLSNHNIGFTLSKGCCGKAPGKSLRTSLVIRKEN